MFGGPCILGGGPPGIPGPSSPINPGGACPNNPSLGLCPIGPGANPMFNMSGIRPTEINIIYSSIFNYISTIITYFKKLYVSTIFKKLYVSTIF
jgi:hypothetical protein